MTIKLVVKKMYVREVKHLNNYYVLLTLFLKVYVLLFINAFGISKVILRLAFYQTVCILEWNPQLCKLHAL